MTHLPRFLKYFSPAFDLMEAIRGYHIPPLFTLKVAVSMVVILRRERGTLHSA